MQQDVKLQVNDEQGRILAEKKGNIKRFRFYLSQAIDNHDLREALRQSACMLAELRTPDLSPDKYYDLYLSVSQELLALQQFFSSDVSVRDKSYQELYELVQHAGNVLPRLYLMCTVGGVYMAQYSQKAQQNQKAQQQNGDGAGSADEAAAGSGPAENAGNIDQVIAILNDLVDMCKGVQHPVRGLFLRHYLCQVCRDHLPDSPPPPDEPTAPLPPPPPKSTTP